LSTYKHLEKFTNGHCTIGDLNEKLCNDFREYLLTAPTFQSPGKTLSQNSAHSYFNKFKAAVRQAFEDKLLPDNPSKIVKRIKQAETQREFLTFEELQALFRTDCEIPLLKKAAIFSSLTGLRFGDIQKLVWGEIQHSNADGYFIRFTQEKTKGAETLYISQQARDQLGDSGVPQEKVFKGLKYNAWYNIKLKQWVMSAGISKNITFHCFRHTYATLLITLGTDIYEVSKMLGHKELKTTQVYAKIIDKKKVDAANRIPDLNSDIPTTENETHGKSQYDPEREKKIEKLYRET